MVSTGQSSIANSGLVAGAVNERNAGTRTWTAWMFFTPLRFAMVLGVLLIAAYPEVVFGGKTFFYRDFSIFGYPLACYHRECFWRGDWPLWNPLNNCGVPFLAQWNTMTLYPLSLFYLLLPLTWSLGVFCVGHLFLGGLGMYFLALRWTDNRLAATIAGVAFAFNGFSSYALVWPPIVGALGWMPWVVATVERAWQAGRNRILAAALVGAIQMLTGGVEVILLTWVILGALLLGESLRRNEGERRAGSRKWFRFILVVVLVSGLSAIQVLPFLDLLAHSQRNAGFSDADWAMPLSGFANFLVPLFHTYRSFHGVFMQYGQQWVASNYFGIGVTALALLALWRARDARTWALALVGGFGLVLALGDQSPVYPALRKILPQISLMRFPVKFIIPAVFIVPLLAAHAIARWERPPNQTTPTQDARPALFLAVTITLLIGLVLWAARQHPMPKDDWALTLRNGLERTALLWVFLGGLFALRLARSSKVHLAAGFALIVALWIDFRTHTPSLSPTVDRQVYESGVGRSHWNQQPAPAHGESRAFVSPEALARLRHSSVATPEDETLGRRLALFGNLNLLDDLPKVNGFFALYPRETEEWLSLLYPTPAANSAQLLDFLNVSHVTAPETLMDWSPRPGFMRLATAGQRPVFVEPAQTLSAMRDLKFNPREVVLLPGAAEKSVPVKSQTRAKITSQRFVPHRAELGVDAGEPSIVVLAQSFYHPWRAKVDGKPTEIWRANHGFQALVVPAGQHQVILTYEDNAFRLGTIVSSLSLVVCGIGWFLHRRNAGTALNGHPGTRA